MSVLNSYRDWSRRRETAQKLRALSHRQLEDIGAFDAANADRMRDLLNQL